MRKLAFGLALAAAAAGAAASLDKDTVAGVWPTLDGRAPFVIAHRGASGERPEHTLAAYELAIDQGADAIEPDLVLTKDGVLVARHDRYLSTTTNVADVGEFADRRRVDPAGDGRIDWWVEDFTLEELKVLRARQPRVGRAKAFDDRFEIPTFAEVLALAAEKAASGRPVAIYPETKHPGYFAAIGLAFDAPLLDALDGFDAGDVYIQSFEPEILRRLRNRTDAALVLLVGGDADPESALALAAEIADGIGPDKSLLVDKAGRPSGFVEAAHEAGLFVHAWTFRDDDHEGGDAAAAELQRVFRLGVDGVFADFPARAISVREGLAEERATE